MNEAATASITPRIDFATELAGLYDLRGHVAFLPGGYGGIGEAIAWTLALAGALVMLVKQHAMELAPERITVNGIAPTFVYTELIRHVMENDAFRRQLLERI